MPVPYGTCDVTIRYFDDSGMRSLPVTGNGQEDAVFVQVRSRITYKIVTFAMEAAGAPPVVPQKDPNDDNETYLWGETELSAVQFTGEGGWPIYNVTGYYVYGIKKPKGIGDTVPFPIPPFITYEYGQDTDDFFATLDEDRYVPGISSPMEKQSSSSGD